METTVFAAMMVAAAFHAGWNAMVKVRLEPRLASTLLGIAGGVVALPLVFLFPLPDAAAWPFLIASMIIHVLYFQALGWAYEAGDLGQVYPLARGTAPLLTTLGATFLVREPLSLAGWAGVVVLAAGVIAMSLKGARDASRFEARAVGFALLTAASIGAYTLVDGLGVRRAGHTGAYIAWGFVLCALALIVYGRWHWKSGLEQGFVKAWRPLLLGGAMSIVSYGIALWAMTKAPIALVAALRETSVLFAALIGVVFLKEPVLARRIAAGALVMAGVVLLRLA